MFYKKQVGMIAISIRRILWYIQKSSCVRKLYNKRYLELLKAEGTLGYDGNLVCLAEFTTLW